MRLSLGIHRAQWGYRESAPCLRFLRLLATDRSSPRSRCGERNPATPEIGWSTNLNDAGSDGCRASHALVSCNGPSVGCECTSDDATTCPPPATLVRPTGTPAAR